MHEAMRDSISPPHVLGIIQNEKKKKSKTMSFSEKPGDKYKPQSLQHL